MSESTSMQDKVAIVTGAGRGIGRDIALLLAKYGARVVVNDLGGDEGGRGQDKGPAQEVVEEIQSLGGEAIANTDSVTDFDAAHNMVEQAIANFGRVDAVVNNAGNLRDRMFHKMSEEEFDAVIAVHLKGAFNVSRAAAPHFRKQQSGTYVHMTSSSGLIGNFGQSNYGAAKLGMVGLSKNIALDMSRYNVRSNCIAPSAWSRLIGTVPTGQHMSEERLASIKAMTPAKIAPMAVFLCSDAASEVNAQVFGVRNNEIFLYSQPRPIRGMHTREGWTVESITERVLPAMKSSFVPFEHSGQVFPWTAE